MKNVLVTGCAGMLGSHLAKYHLEAGDNVYGIDNHSSSSPNSQHLLDLLSYERMLFIEGDICEPRDLLLFRKRNISFDLIYNFACPASPPIYQSIPIETMMTCVRGTSNVLEFARNTSPEAVIVHASTSEVYGDPDVSPQVESYRGCVNSYGPRACYDEGKRSAEALCFDHKNTRGTDVRLVRIFNTYGPHMSADDGRVVSNFITQVLAANRLTIYGQGQQTRSFCYVDDLIRGIVALGALDGNPGTPVNLGNPNEFTINELAKEIIHQVRGGRDVAWREIAHWIDYKPLPVDDPKQRCPDITLARNLLGWEPKVQLAEGIAKTIEHFKKVMTIK